MSPEFQTLTAEFGMVEIFLKVKCSELYLVCLPKGVCLFGLALHLDIVA